MEQSSGNRSSCEFSLGRPRFGSTQEDQAEDDKKEAETIGLMEEEEEDDDDDGAKSADLEGDVEEIEEKKHICRACGKSFRSGKALGDHKRLHMLQTRKFSMVRPKMVSGRYDERGEFEVDCCVCHKKFTSMNALYGHMRFHPDRGWKGVLPPPHPLANVHNGELISSDDDDDDDDGDDENSELWNNQGLGNLVDLKEMVKGWRTTRKRGRRSALRVDESALKDTIDAKNLLFFATTAESAGPDVTETSHSHSGKEKTKKTKRKKKKRLCEMEKEPSTTHQLDVVAGGAREKHVCVTCNKSFTSYQALGGHRASHNKVKILDNHQARANGDVLLLGTEAMITGLANAQRPNTASLSSNGDHVCNKCHKSFPTGQALGGHKRRHWSGPVSSEAATSPAAASSSQVAETVEEVRKLKRTPLEFDLNELPPNEE